MTRTELLDRVRLLERERVRDYDALLLEARAPVPAERVAGLYVPPCPPITPEIAAKNRLVLDREVAEWERRHGAVWT